MLSDLLEYFAEEGDRVTSVDANTLLVAIRTSEFIMGLVAASRGLAKTVGLSMALQSPSQHLGQAFHQVTQIKKELLLEREAALQAFQEASSLAASVGSGTIVPRRSVGRQSTRSNTPAATPEEFFARNCYCLLYTSPSPRDLSTSRMPSSA